MPCRFDDSFRARPPGRDRKLSSKFGKISASVGFIKKKFVTMHGHMNVKVTHQSICRRYYDADTRRRVHKSHPLASILRRIS
jgi:hypothetical protein